MRCSVAASLSGDHCSDEPVVQALVMRACFGKLAAKNSEARLNFAELCDGVLLLGPEGESGALEVNGTFRGSHLPSRSQTHLLQWHDLRVSALKTFQTCLRTDFPQQVARRGRKSKQDEGNVWLGQWATARATLEECLRVGGLWETKSATRELPHSMLSMPRSYLATLMPTAQLLLCGFPTFVQLGLCVAV